MPSSLIVAFIILKIAFLFWDMIVVFGIHGSDLVTVVLYSRIGMMYTFCGNRSTI